MNDKNAIVKKDAFMLTEKERKLIELIHSMEYGEVSIFIQNGQPVRVEEIKRSIKL
ncbi:MAG: putative small protein [Tepidanaerobacteraceae bacterium]|nr:putative small protein [Tepidanaerobacteraceae bacterium]